VLQFPLQLPAPAITPTLVSYRLVAGTATPGVDYDPSTQDVLLPVGASAAAISVDTYPFFDGPPRQFRVELLSASGLVLAADSATGTLTSRPSTVFADGFE
jgi:hypothetical protein